MIKTRHVAKVDEKIGFIMRRVFEETGESLDVETVQLILRLVDAYLREKGGGDLSDVTTERLAEELAKRTGVREIVSDSGERTIIID